MIHPLTQKDADEVARLHLENLRTFFRGLAGRKLLACHYRALARGNGAFGYAWAAEGESMAGFVCGVWDAGRLRRTLLRQEWHRLVFWGAVHVIAHPSNSGREIGRASCR